MLVDTVEGYEKKIGLLFDSDASGYVQCELGVGYVFMGVRLKRFYREIR